MNVAVVLGNRMLSGGEISVKTAERLALAIEYYNAEKPDFVILSGGLANPKAGITEAEAMRKALHGAIPEDKLISEDRSLTTAENARFSVPIALGLGADRITLISSEDHLKRRYLNPVRLFRKYLKRRGAPHVALYTYKKV